MSGLLPELQDDTWDEVFKYAWPPRPPTAVIGDAAPVSPFDRADVEAIVGIIEGQKDGDDWLVCGRLRDGRWFALRAWCDYTGWG